MFAILKWSSLTSIIAWVCFCANFHANAESCHGAIVRNGTNQTIVDGNNDTWTIKSDNKIYINTEEAGISSEVILLVYWDRAIYQQNRYGGWWRWVDKISPWADAMDPRNSSNTNTGPRPVLPYCSDDLTTTKTTDTSTVFESIRTSVITEETIMPFTSKPPLSYFVPHSCNDTNYIGDSCNTSMKPCDVYKPCRNSGNCTNDPSCLHGYSCMCKPDYHGTNCEYEIGPCKSNTCLHNGTCKEMNETDFHCNCTQGRTGIHCELLIDCCKNVTCLNKGICRSLLLDYKCECLFGTSGQHCENMETSLLIRQYVSKGFGYIAIIALIATAGFIIVLDILKYGFGIDPVCEERERIRRKRALSKQKNHDKSKPLNYTRN